MCMCLRTRMLSPTNINPYFQMNKSPYCYQIHSPNLCVPAVPQACLQGSRYVHRVCSMRPHIVPRAACHTHMNTTVYLSFCSRMCPSQYYTYIHTFYMHFFYSRIHWHCRNTCPRLVTSARRVCFPLVLRHTAIENASNWIINASRARIVYTRTNIASDSFVHSYSHPIRRPENLSRLIDYYLYGVRTLAQAREYKMYVLRTSPMRQAQVRSSI